MDAVREFDLVGLRGYRAPVRAPAPFLLFAVVLGCASSDDPRAVAGRSWLEALAKRDAAAAYTLLAPDAKKKVAELYGVLTETRDRIQSDIPPKNRADTLAATGLARLPEGGPEVFFVELFAATGEPFEVGGLVDLGLRPKRLDGDTGTSTVTTLGGDSVALVQDEGGNWRAQLSAEDMARLDSLLATANQNKARVSEAVRVLTERRYGGQ